MSNFIQELEDRAWAEFERRIEHGNNTLKPANSVRFTRPRVCATCKHCVIASGFVQCVRPNGPSFDAGDLQHWTTVCDRWDKGVYDE